MKDDSENEAQAHGFVQVLAEKYGNWLEKVFEYNTSAHVLNWDIKDFAQELYLNLIRRAPEKLPDLEDEASVKRYIRTCAKHVIRDRVRMLNRRPQKAGSSDTQGPDQMSLVDDRVDPHAAAPDESSIHTETIEQMCGFFGQYSTRTEEIGKLKLLQGKTHGEIAEILGHSKDVIAKRWQLLSREIRRRLTDNEQ